MTENDPIKRRVETDRIGGIRTQLVGSALQGVALFLYIPFDGLAALYVVSLVFGLAQGGLWRGGGA